MEPNVYLAYIYFLKNQDGKIRRLDELAKLPIFKDRRMTPLISVIYERQRNARANFILQEQILWNNAGVAGFRKFLEKYGCKNEDTKRIR